MPIGAAIGGGFNLLTSTINNINARKREQEARKENFEYGEKAANAADQRTRALYNDLYSSEAQMEQLKEAGLSPSIFASGGMAGKSGVSGAQGGGASGVQPNVFGVDPMNAALTASEIALKKAQTNNLEEDTTTKQIENEIKALNAQSFKNEWEVINNTSFGNENGAQSWSSLVSSSNDYKEFENKVYEITKLGGGVHSTFIRSEKGQQTLRSIYEANKKFDNEIATLANSKENADLMLGITKLLNNEQFVKASADAQKQQLKQIYESAELTTEQKGAMNRLIDKMGHSTTSDIVITLLLMLGQYTSVSANVGFNRSEVLK